MLAALSSCAQCPDPLSAPSIPVDRLHFPTGLAVHPTLPILFVANSNFDLSYSNGAVLGANLQWLYQRLQDGDIPIERIESPFTSAALVPSIGGPLLMSPDGKHLYHVGRQDNLLVALDVDASEDALFLHCGDRTEGLPDCTTGDHVEALANDDPFGLAVRPSGNGWQVLVGALRNGGLHFVQHDPGVSGENRLVAVTRLNLGNDDRGASLALLPSVAGMPEYLLASGRVIPGTDPAQGHVRFLSLDEGPTGVTGRLDLRNEAGAMDVRGVAVSAARERAYAVVKYPASLVEIDMRRDPGGVPSGRVLRTTQLGKEPSTVALYEPPSGPNLILTVSFRDGLLVALDMDTLEIFDVVRDVGKNPFDIAVDTRNGFAFVSNFNDDTVAVIRLPRGQLENGQLDLRFGLAARLGLKRDDTQTNPDLPTSLTDLPTLPRF